MSEHELQRIEVLPQVLDGSMRPRTAANLLDLRLHQRLLRGVRAHGAGAVRHGLRGRPSNNRIGGLKRASSSLRSARVMPLAAPCLRPGCWPSARGPDFRRNAAPVDDGGPRWQSRVQRRRVHPPRLRRECYGGLIQIDGAGHRWFKDRASVCTLPVLIGDATGRLMQRRFAPSQTTCGHFNALEGHVREHGRPAAFHSDRHSGFRGNRAEARNGLGMTRVSAGR